MQAVIYARYSSHGQTEQSIEGQLRDCYSFAQREGLNVVGEYIDRAITGRTDERPDFQRMIFDAQKKQFQRVIVWKLDRFARNRYDSAFYKSKLKKYGVKVISATEPISDEPEGIILEGLLESMAEYYSANLSKHVRRGQRENSINGHFCGGSVPYGYRVEDHRLVIDERTAPVVKRVFERYDGGASVTEIRDELNSAGYRNSRGRPFTISVLQHLLSNEKYIGIYKNGELLIQNGCPPIIDDELWRRVKQRQEARKKRPAAVRAVERYLLSGKVFCGYCGANLNGECGTSKNGAVYHYYMCRNKKQRKGCKKKNEKKGFLEWYVTEQTALYVLQPDRMDYIADQVVAQYEKEFGHSQADALERQRSRIEDEINTLVDTLATAPKAAQKRIFARIEELESQSTDLEISIAKLRMAEQIKLTKDQVIAWMQTFCRGDPIDGEFQERIIDTFVNSVYLYDDHLIIYYNVKDGQQVSYMEMLETTADFDVDAGVFGCHSPRPAKIDDGRTHLIFLTYAFGIVLPLRRK